MAPKNTEIPNTLFDWDLVQDLNDKPPAQDDVAKLVPILGNWAPDDEEDLEKLRLVFKVCYKSLNYEFNSNKNQREKNEEMKREQKSLQRKIRRLETRGTGDADIDRTLQDLRAAEDEKEKLRKELQILMNELDDERDNKEDLDKKLQRALDENKTLQSEVDGLKAQLSMTNTTNFPGSELDETEERRLRELEESVRMKNKQIHQLLDDIDHEEKEKLEYQNKVLELRDQLQDATREMNNLVSEYVVIKDEHQNHQTFLKTIQKENEHLSTLSEEHILEKKTWEDKMEQHKDEMTKVVDDMKVTIEEKDTTIEELMARLRRANLDPNGGDSITGTKEDISVMTRALREREEQIEVLQEKLEQASKQLEDSADLIEHLRGAKSSGKSKTDPIQKSLMKAREDLLRSENKVKELEADLKEAEDVATEKTEELSEVIKKIRKYEKGEYGLEQSEEELKKCKRQIKSRDKYIEELVQNVNDLQMKVGTSPEPISSTHAYSKSQQNKALMQILQREIERLEEERIHLKCENRKMAKQLGHKAAQLGLDSDDLKAVHEYTEALKRRRAGFAIDIKEPPVEAHQGFATNINHDVNKHDVLKQNELQQEIAEQKSKYDHLLEENDKLRLGMQQILDSVREQDGKSDVRIQSEILEDIITALDARHLWGSYHPAMSLKSRIEKLEGMNSELRDQLRKSRLDEDKALSQCEKLRTRLEHVETELSLYENEGICLERDLPQIQSSAPQSKRNGTLTLDLPRSSSGSIVSPIGLLHSGGNQDLVSKLNTHIIQVLDQLHSKDDANKNLQEELETLKGKYGVIRHQMGLMYEEYQGERNQWKEQRNLLQEEKNSLQEDLKVSNLKVEEFEDHIKALASGPDECEAKYAEATRRSVLLKANEAIMIRKYKALEDNEKILRKDYNKLKEESLALENEVIDRMGALQRYKDVTGHKVESLQKQVANSVPVALVDNLNKKYTDLTADYRDLLQKEQMTSAQERKTEKLQSEVSTLKNESTYYQDQLKVAKEKLLRIESTLSCQGLDTHTPEHYDNQIQSLVKQMATLELKEMNERNRASHAESQASLQKMQLTQIEDRNKEMEANYSEITRANLELQKTERALRDELVTSTPKEEYLAALKKLEEHEHLVIELKVENDRLKEVADIARNQIELFESKENVESIELESLRHAILELQSQSDEQALVGKLHRQVINMQIRENESLQKFQMQQHKIARLESQLYRLNKKADEKEELVHKIRAQYILKCRTMQMIIQDLRIQYSGSIPLAKQEKLTKALTDLSNEKKRYSDMLKSAEDKAYEADTKAEEMLIKKEALDELLETLKSKKVYNKIMEWQSKLEELRIRDMRSRKKVEHLSKQLDHLQSLSSSQTYKVDQLEEEVLRMENALEKKQLEWEQKEVGSDDFLDSSHKSKDFATEDFSQEISAPDSSLSLAKQLEQSLRIIKTMTNNLEETKKDLMAQKRMQEQNLTKIRELEANVHAKDKIINDLRMQVPASVDRAVAVASIAGKSGLTVPLTEDYESKQALNIAQSTVTSLRERLAQKEDTLARYEEILNQTRKKHEEVLKQKQLELVALQTTVRKGSQAYNELKQSLATEGSSSSYKTTNSVIVKQAKKNQDLEEDIQHLQSSLTSLSHQLAQARSDCDKHIRMANAKQRDLDELNENKKIESQMTKHQFKSQLDKQKGEINMLKQENLMLQEDLQTLKETESRTPSAIMKSLVEKLRNDVSEKEKKIKAMNKAISELKKQLLQQAEEVNSKPSKSKLSGTSDEMLTAQDLQQKVSLLLEENAHMQRRVRKLEEQELSYFSQIKTLKEQLSRQAKPSYAPKLAPDGDMHRDHSSALDEEKESLCRRIRELESKVKQFQQAEKPFGEDHESKAIKNAEEVARWDEKKKWEHKLEIAKKRHSEAVEERAKLEKTAAGLRECVQRLEREKIILDNRARSAQKASASKTRIFGDKLEMAQKENDRLKEEVEKHRHASLMSGEEGREALSLKNRLLTEKLRDQERKITMLEMGKKFGGSSKLLEEMESLQSKERNRDKKMRALEEENSKLKFERNENHLVSGRIRGCQEILQRLIEAASVDIDKQKLTQALDCLTSVHVSSEEPWRAKGNNKLSPKEIQNLIDEVKNMEKINSDLLKDLEDKEREILKLRHSQKSITLPPPTSGGEAQAQVVQVESQLTGQTGTVSLTQLREMEADLKRKSDLLAEVKVLLRKAAEREKAQLRENEELKTRMRLVLEVDPKSPSDILAKELRQTRLTVERLECEKKELEHQLKINSAAGC